MSSSIINFENKFLYIFFIIYLTWCNYTFIPIYFTRMYFNLLSFEINQIMNLFEYIYIYESQQS